MKPIFIYIVCTLAMVCSGACQQKQQMDTENSRKTSFATPEEAANQGKSDLLNVMRSQKMTFGVQGAAIEKSQPAKPLKHYQITFEELLSAGTFANFTRNELATVVPLVADNNVVTTAEVAKDDSGWKIAALADKSLSDELNAVRRVAGDQSDITIYDLPHSQFKVYGVVKNAGAGQPAGAMFHTAYPGFGLAEGVPAERLLPVLKQDAAEIQQKHGDALKSQKLAH